MVVMEIVITVDHSLGDRMAKSERGAQIHTWQGKELWEGEGASNNLVSSRALVLAGTG